MNEKNKVFLFSVVEAELREVKIRGGGGGNNNERTTHTVAAHNNQHNYYQQNKEWQSQTKSGRGTLKRDPRWLLLR